MNTQSQTKAWFESSVGTRYDVPQDATPPINVGRATGTAGDAGAVTISQSEQTKFISRRHATLWRSENGQWEISDAGSTSGLWVNGVKAEGDRRFPMTEGTKVRLGNFDLTFRLVQAAEGGGGVDGGTVILPDFKPEAPAAFGPAVPAESSDSTHASW